MRLNGEIPVGHSLRALILNKRNVSEQVGVFTSPTVPYFRGHHRKCHLTVAITRGHVRLQRKMKWHARNLCSVKLQVCDSRGKETCINGAFVRPLDARETNPKVQYQQPVLEKSLLRNSSCLR